MGLEHLEEQVGPATVVALILTLSPSVRDLPRPRNWDVPTDAVPVPA